LIVIIYIGIILGVVIGAFVIELLIAALYPGVSVPKQYLRKTKGLPREDENNAFGIRKDVSFQVKGSSVSGWLFLPEGRSSPVPCIVMAHGLGGTKAMGLDSYAIRFQEAGIAVLAFDYRYTGESGGSPRQLIWVPSQLEDYTAAINYARSLKEIDPARIALWGTSLSGGHVIATAAEDNKIACVSAQCPLLDGTAGYEQQLHKVGMKYMFRIVGHAQRDLVRSWLGLSPYKIPLVGKPGTVALMADMDAWNTFSELAPHDFINEACARIGIRMDKYRPVSQIGKIQCPVLLQVCDFDITLPADVVKQAEEKLGPLAEIKRYPIGHFDIYLGDNFEKAVNDQLAFFKKHLLNKFMVL
jgi:fermentation-respiration switch protein FrsA (DUF1100 family)